MSHAEDHEGTRRDFLYYATAGAGAITAGAAVWPLVNQMNPSADVKALSSIRVDISEIEPGTQLTVKWLGKPVFIRRRTEDEISEARGVAMDDLIDLSARNNNAPELDAADENRALDETGEWLVMMGVCTHLGLCAFGRWRWRLSRLVLPLPWIALRYIWSHSQRPCSGELAGAYGRFCRRYYNQIGLRSYCNGWNPSRPF